MNPDTLPNTTPLSSEEMPKPLPGTPSQKAQSWGVVISIVVIVMMIVVGAFYAWGERISQNSAYSTAIDDSGL